MDDDCHLLIQRARTGDEQALADLFEQHRERLKRMIYLRLDPRVRARVDASDVLQDAFVDAARKIAEYGQKSEIPFFLWLRLIAVERLVQLQRMHLGAAKRSVQREISLQSPITPEASSMFLASRLAGQFTSADRPLIRAEMQNKIEEILTRMDPGDREIIALRHFEELTTDEITRVLGLSRSGVLKRYTRAIQRLREALRGDSDLKIGPIP